jgi:hypothetical protein
MNRTVSSVVILVSVAAPLVRATVRAAAITGSDVAIIAGLAAIDDAVSATADWDTYGLRGRTLLALVATQAVDLAQAGARVEHARSAGGTRHDERDDQEDYAIQRS